MTEIAKSEVQADGDGTRFCSKKTEGIITAAAAAEFDKNSAKQEMNIKTLTPLELKLFPLESTMIPDGNTTAPMMIGSPLQASSPLRTPPQQQSQAEEEGNKGSGDANAINSVQSLISPIHRSKACHQIHLPGSNSSMMGMSSAGSSAFDNLLADFQRQSSPQMKRPPSLPKENILPEISKMNEEEAKKLLTKVVKDNMELRQELRSKEKRISAFKGQMLAILEWKARQEMDAFSEGSSSTEDSHGEIKSKSLNLPKKVSTSKMKKKETLESDESGSSEGSKETVLLNRNSLTQKLGPTGSNNAQEVRVVEEVFGIRRSLSFIQELASSIDVDQELLRHRIRDGCYLTNQLLLGGVSGWLSALFVKKFGKLALSAAGGGLLVLIYTTRKGFVNVNYESIYQEISRLCEGENASGDASAMSVADCDKKNENQRSSITNLSIRGDEEESSALNKSQDCTTWDRIRTARRWLASNTYTVGGFALTFIYNIV